MKRLYIVTGKGGVGKTTIALSLTALLHEQKRRVLYLSYDQPENETLCKELDIPWINLKAEDSTQLYIEQKFNSKLVAAWILKTPFFSSLFKIVPAISHLIFVGHIVDMLKKDRELTIIFDSPSSGHALTMFEASHNLKTIFKSGIIFNDIKELHNFLHEEDKIGVLIPSLPTQLSIQEALETNTYLKQLNINQNKIIINNSIAHTAHTTDDLSPFMKKKIDQEFDLSKQYKENISFTLPFYTKQSFIENIQEMKNNLRDIQL